MAEAALIAAEAPRFTATAGVAQAITAADSALREGRLDNARSVGAATFDGALAAAADSPVSAGTTARGLEGRLAPPTDLEMAEAYALASPRSGAIGVIGARGFANAVSELLMQYTFAGRAFVEQMAASVPYFDIMGQRFLEAVKDLVAAHDATDPASRRFQELAGRYYAFVDAQEDKTRSALSFLRPKQPPHMPPSPLAEGEYWDMAAGINAGRYVRRPEVNRTTPYVLFDASNFVASYLRASARMAGKENVMVREQDLLSIERPAKPIAVLRTKNAVAYVPGFDKKLEQMVDWIAPGGQLIIQNDPNYAQRGLIIEKHGDLIRRLIREGWTLDFGFAGGAGGWGRYGYDTIALTRPRGTPAPKTAADADKTWSSYLAAVRYADRRSSGY